MTLHYYELCPHLAEIYGKRMCVYNGAFTVFNECEPAKLKDERDIIEGLKRCVLKRAIELAERNGQLEKTAGTA